jgi:hypothetical protein
MSKNMIGIQIGTDPVAILKIGEMILAILAADCEEATKVAGLNVLGRNCSSDYNTVKNVNIKMDGNEIECEDMEGENDE